MRCHSQVTGWNAHGPPSSWITIFNGHRLRCSIVIRAKNEARFIGDTLEAIAQQEFSSDLEIIVVDSGSTDGTSRLSNVPSDAATDST